MKCLLLAGLLLPLHARTMEKLDRGLVAVRQGDGSVYAGWRLLGDDPKGAAFNL